MSELIKDTASNNFAQNPYADIDKLIANQNSLLEQQQTQQNAILDQQAQMQIDQINRNKQEVDENATKTNSALYTEYKKAVNPYGPNAEQLYTKGLGNSGYAESTQTNLYNQYQKNITDTVNTASKLKADFDFKIQDAMKNRDLQKAQYALQLYQQKLNLLAQEYDLKNNKEQDLYNRSIDERNYNYQVNRDNIADSQWNKQFDYQQSRDTVADSQWEKQYQQMLKEYADNEKWKQANFDYQKSRDAISDKRYDQQFDYQKSRDSIADSQWNQNFNYQVGRDKVADNQWQQSFDYQKSRDSVADSQWEREFALAQAAKASSGGSRSSGGRSSYSSSGGSTQTSINLNADEPVQQPYQLSDAGQQFVNSYLAMKNSFAGKAISLENMLKNSGLNSNDIQIIIDRYA